MDEITLYDVITYNGVDYIVTDIAEFDDLMRIENLQTGKGQFVPKP